MSQPSIRYSHEWGAALTHYMKLNNMTDRQLAEWLRAEVAYLVVPSTISRWRKGQVPRAGMRIVPFLALKFDCPLREFVPGRGEVRA